MAEWLKAPDSKSGVGATLPWVRIPPLPPVRFSTSYSQSEIRQSPGRAIKFSRGENGHTTNNQIRFAEKFRCDGTFGRRHELQQLRAARHRGDSKRVRRPQRDGDFGCRVRIGALEFRDRAKRFRRHRSRSESRLHGEGNPDRYFRRARNQTRELANQSLARHHRYRRVDDWRMGFPSRA